MIILDIPQTWQFVSYVRNEVREYLPDSIDDEIREAAVMVASELTENAIKFGSAIEKQKTANIDVNVEDDSICIKITSGVTSDQNLEILKGIIDRINASDNVEALYLERLQEMLDDPSQNTSRLGFLRIVHEAHFKIDYHLSDDTLVISATRHFNAQ